MTLGARHASGLFGVILLVLIWLTHCMHASKHVEMNQMGVQAWMAYHIGAILWILYAAFWLDLPPFIPPALQDRSDGWMAAVVAGVGVHSVVAAGMYFSRPPMKRRE
jgi:hypothetical protein